MQLSAELRYFWKDSPVHLREWFHGTDVHPCKAGGGGLRCDQYLRDGSQTELGLKSRGEKPGIEVKGLVAVSAVRLPPPFSGEVEIWSKWTSASLQLSGLDMIEVRKTRWLRKFDTGGTEIPLDVEEKPLPPFVLPEAGCNVELTSLQLDDSITWWSLGLESFGALWQVERSLRLAADLLITRHVPALNPDIVASYPSWLASKTRQT